MQQSLSPLEAAQALHRQLAGDPSAVTLEMIHEYMLTVRNACAVVASQFSTNPYALHPDIRLEDMAEPVRMASHSTAQLIAIDISRLE